MNSHGIFFLSFEDMMFLVLSSTLLHHLLLNNSITHLYNNILQLHPLHNALPLLRIEKYKCITSQFVCHEIQFVCDAMPCFWMGVSCLNWAVSQYCIIGIADEPHCTRCAKPYWLIRSKWLALQTVLRTFFIRHAYNVIVQAIHVYQRTVGVVVLWFPAVELNIRLHSRKAKMSELYIIMVLQLYWSACYCFKWKAM